MTIALRTGVEGIAKRTNFCVFYTSRVTSRFIVALIAFALAPLRTPAQGTMEIDNPWVRVLRVTRGAGEKIVVRARSSTVLVWLSDFRGTVTPPTGAERRVAFKAGDVEYLEFGEMAAADASNQAHEAVMIELKPEAPASAPIALDPVKLDPVHHPVLLENERVRAIRTILEPHLKSPLHEHPHYVVVYLTELHTAMTLASGISNPRRAAAKTIAAAMLPLRTRARSCCGVRLMNSSTNSAVNAPPTAK